MTPLLCPINAFAATWADALVRACWQGGLVIALVWLVCRLWPGLPPIPRCRLWRLAYAKLLLGLVWLPPLALPLLPRPPAPPPSVQAAAPLVATAQAPLTEAPPMAPGTAQAPLLAAPPAPLPSQPPPSRPTLPTVQTWLLTTWLLGILVSLGQIAAAWGRARIFYDTSTPLADEGLRADAAELGRRLGLCRIPPLRVADGLASPVLLGLTRPAILLPAFVVTDRPRPELRLMLAHELAHLARRDLQWNGLPLLAQRLFFFHPLVWLAGQEWSLAQEIACDALAVKVTDAPPSAYGRMLLGIATRRASAAPLFPTLAVAAPRHTLRRRLFAMQHLGTASRPRVVLAAALTLALAVGGLLPWRVVAQSGLTPSTHAVVTQGDDTWQKQDQKQQADIASKNAQLDAQLVEVQKNLSPAQLKKVQSWIASINAEYAKWQQRVQVSERSRAAYIASHPNRLSDAQIAFVQKVNWNKMHHKRISESVRTEYAAIPKDQRDRVALLRSYSFEVLGVRMFAFIEKEAAVSVLQQRLAGKLPARQQSRDAATKAPIAPPHASTASPSALALSGPPSLRVAQFTRGTTGATQPNNPAPAPVRISPVMAEALDKEIAYREKHLRTVERQRADFFAAHPGTLSDNQQADLDQLQYLTIQRNDITSGIAWGEVVKAKLRAHLVQARDARSRKSFQAQIAVVDANRRSGEERLPVLERRIARQKEVAASIPQDQRQSTAKKAQLNTSISVEGSTIAFLKARRAGAAWAQASITSPEFNLGGLKDQRLDNMRRFEVEAQRDKYVAEHYVYLLATMEEFRHIAPSQDQWFRQMKRRNAVHGP